MRHYEIRFQSSIPIRSEQVPADGRTLQRPDRRPQRHGAFAWRTGGGASSLTDRKVHKAHYVLMNIECDNETLTELEHSFKSATRCCAT